MNKFVVGLACLFIMTQNSPAQNRQAPDFRFHIIGKPSSRDLLHRRDAAFAFKDQQVDTIRILAIRVEFQPDTLQQTTGTGQFVLTPPDSPTIDPPPHNRSYFDAQLQALANYYSTVSQGKLVLRWDILPAGESVALQLPHDLQYYAPGKESANADQRLAQLFQEGLQIADQQNQLDFSQFQSFLLFHAGVGSDLSLDFDPTPNDVPSAFLTFADLRKDLGNNDPGYQGIPVQNGQFFIRDGIILPETESQEGFEIGLLGTSAIMLGFQIGLPSLFNPDNGLSGVGRFGLMDQGSGNFQGLLPAEPNAWEKIFMGWEKPIVIQNGKNLQVAAPHAPFSPNHVYKIPINDDEYFLLENRQRDLNGDKVAVGSDVYGNRVEFQDPGQIESNAVIGVITQVDEYDFGLPGSGILIWHIDESIIRARLAENRINSDREHRGVDLEEADGAQDIGRVYGFFSPGSGAENGLQDDMWDRDNPINTLVNNSSTVRFAPDTKPWSRSYSGANSHIVISDFSENKPLMSFSVTNDAVLENFPQYVGPEVFPPLAAELDPANAGREILVARNDGTISAFHSDGSGIFPGTAMVTVSAPGKEERAFPLAIFLETGANLRNPPALADVNGDGADEVIVGTQAGTLTVYSSGDADQNNRADVVWSKDLGSAVTSNIAIDVAANRLYCGTANGTVFVFNFAGDEVARANLDAAVRRIARSARVTLAITDNGTDIVQSGSAVAVIAVPTAAIAIADLDNDGNDELVSVTAQGKFVITNARGEIQYDFQLAPPAKINAFAVGDVDKDGRKDFVFIKSNQLFALNYHGANLENFPVDLGTIAGENNPFDAPILVAGQGGSEQNIFVPGPVNDLFGFAGTGETLDGFPLALAGGAPVAAGAADVDGDGKLEIMAATADGFLHVFRLPGSAADAPHAWPFWNGSMQQTLFNPRKETPTVQAQNLLPKEQAYNYPNPTEGNSTTIRYFLNDAAEVKIKILDLAGDLVDEFSGPGVPHVANEIQWSLANIQSGVYLARIEARGSGSREVTFFKIAVVK